MLRTPEPKTRTKQGAPGSILRGAGGGGGGGGALSKQQREGILQNMDLESASLNL